MDAVTQRSVRSAAVAAALVVGSVGCGGEPAAMVGAPVSDEVAELTVVSDDRRVTSGAVCIADIPDDLADCTDSREELSRLELDETRKAALIVPADIATGGYRLRVDGAPLPGSDGVLGDQYQAFQVPAEIVARPGPTTFTVEALRTAGHPQAVWQFLLTDPAEPPA